MKPMQVLAKLQEILWPLTDPDQSWDSDTIEYVAGVLRDAGFGRRSFRLSATQFGALDKLSRDRWAIIPQKTLKVLWRTGMVDYDREITPAGAQALLEERRRNEAL